VRSTDYEAPRYSSLLNALVTSSLLSPDVFLCTLFSNTLSLCSTGGWNNIAEVNAANNLT